MTAVHKREGFWLDAAFPQSGWRCQGMEDAGNSERLCEMCKSCKERMLHLMVHAELPILLAVGTECAKQMEGNYERVRRRAEAFQFELRIRSEWPKRPWKRSKEGNYYVNVRGFNVATFQKGDEGYGLAVRQQNTFNSDDGKAGTKRYASLAEAQKAGVDALFWARKHLSKGRKFDDWRDLCGSESG